MSISSGYTSRSSAVRSSPQGSGTRSARAGPNDAGDAARSVIRTQRAMRTCQVARAAVHPPVSNDARDRVAVFESRGEKRLDRRRGAPCIALRRSVSIELYATSWVSACLKLYSTSPIAGCS